MSRVLMASISMRMPCLASSLPANCRLAMYVSRMFCSFTPRGFSPAMNVQLLATQGGGIFQGLADAFLKFADFRRIASQPPVASGEISRRHVEQHHFQLVPIELLANLGGRIVVRKQELDTSKAGTGSGSEAIDKSSFVKHHRKIGVELGHAWFREAGSKQ